MKKVLEISVVNVMLFTTWVFASQPAATVGPDQALTRLKDGNARYVELKCVHPRHSQARREETVAQGQHPFATVITCSDSRVPTEMIFDQGIGDLFIIRVAGNVCDSHEIGSAEYGAGHLGASLVVVLGHSQCGAVTAVVNNNPLHGCVASLGECIKPAVDKVRHDHPELKDTDLIAKSIEANVWKSVEDIFGKSEEIRDLVKTGKLTVIGAVYDLKTGKVQWLGGHPEQVRLLDKSEGVKVVEHKTSAAPEKAESPHAAKPANPKSTGNLSSADGHSMVLGHHEPAWVMDLTCEGLLTD